MQQIFVCWFCALKLCWICFICSNTFLVKSLGFSIYKIMACANSDSFASSFPVWTSLISFSCQIALARTSDAMLNKSGKSGHLCLVPDLRGKSFNLSPLSMMLAVGLSYTAFIKLRYVPPIPNLLSFVKCFFFCIYWDDYMIFIFHSVNVVYHIYWFVKVEPPLYPRDKSHLIKTLLVSCWIQFSSILLRIFTSIINRDIGL